MQELWLGYKRLETRKKKIKNVAPYRSRNVPCLEDINASMLLWHPFPPSSIVLNSLAVMILSAASSFHSPLTDFLLSGWALRMCKWRSWQTPLRPGRRVPNDASKSFPHVSFFIRFLSSLAVFSLVHLAICFLFTLAFKIASGSRIIVLSYLHPCVPFLGSFHICYRN